MVANINTIKLKILTDSIKKSRANQINIINSATALQRYIILKLDKSRSLDKTNLIQLTSDLVSLIRFWNTNQLNRTLNSSTQFKITITDIFTNLHNKNHNIATPCNLTASKFEFSNSVRYSQHEFRFQNKLNKLY